MKREQLKKMLKPLIKECIKEVIFEEGVLSGIISEVMKGTGQQVIKEAKSVEKQEKRSPKRDDTKKVLAESKKKLLDAIGTGAYGGIDVFEGTRPLRGAGSVNESSAPSSALANVEPDDAGIDISQLPGSNVWKHLIK